MTLTRLAFPALVLLLASTAAADSFRLRPSSRTPEAAGVIDIKQTSNANEKLTVKVEHLPPPASLAPDLRTFVVWIDPGRGRAPMPVGQILIDEKHRSGEVVTVTAFERFEVLITAESVATPTRPSQHVILQGGVDLAPASK